MNTNFLVLAGIFDSGPEHWQTIWQRGDASFDKLQHSDWETPDRAVWVSELADKVSQTAGPIVLVAHSLACLLVAHWAPTAPDSVTGAFLVSVPDPSGPNFPVAARGFAPIPTARLRFASLVISSADDPYGSQEFMKRCARAWGSRFHSVGNCGHINADSNLGSWHEGRALLRGLEAC
jgi:serine hydrolase